MKFNDNNDDEDEDGWRRRVLLLRWGLTRRNKCGDKGNVKYVWREVNGEKMSYFVGNDFSDRVERPHKTGKWFPYKMSLHPVIKLGLRDRTMKAEIRDRKFDCLLRSGGWGVGDELRGPRKETAGVLKCWWIYRRGVVWRGWVSGWVDRWVSGSVSEWAYKQETICIC